jgi:hypothetical protein
MMRIEPAVIGGAERRKGAKFNHGSISVAGSNL